MPMPTPAGHDRRRRRRIRWAVATTAAALVVSLVVPAAPASSATDTVTIETYPQALPPGDDTKLLANDAGVWFQTYDGSGDGTANLGRIAPDGTVQIDGTTGSAFSYQAPTQTSDGSVWIAVGRDAAAPAPVPSGTALARTAPSTVDLTVAASPNPPMQSSQTAADGAGGFWAQSSENSTIALVGQASGGPIASIQTGVAFVQDQNDLTISNPLVHGPDGRVWLVGAGSSNAGVRVVSVDPSGLVVDAAPAGYHVQGLRLTEAAGQMWVLAIRASLPHHLSVLGVDPAGGTRSVHLTLHAECHAPGLQPVVDGAGDLWFTGSDAKCMDGGGLHFVRVAPGSATHETISTGLSALDQVAAAKPVSQPEGVYTAGLDGNGNLAFAAVDGSGSIQTWATGLQPFVPDGQVTYPLVADPNGGVWAQATDGSGDLVLVYAGPGGTRKVSTGLEPVAREFVIGPDGDPWSQGTDEHGGLVLVRATSGGADVHPTSLEPTDTVWAGVVGAGGDLWFRATDSSGNLVVLRIEVDSVGPTTTTTSTTAPTTTTTAPATPLTPSFTG